MTFYDPARLARGSVGPSAERSNRRSADSESAASPDNAESAASPESAEQSAADRRHMLEAIEWARRCPPSETAFSVGAVIVADGAVLSTGYSRETDAKVHAEEAALNKLDPDDPRLAAATIYSTLEPCSQRGTVTRSPCTDRILAAGIPRVVIAWREPSTFVTNCVGVEKLREHGVTVVELPDLAEAAMSMNRHLEL